MTTVTDTKVTGGEAIARMLSAFGANPMFGMGSWQLLPFYEAARRLGLPHYLINDERGGVFAADAYAKASNRVGLADAGLGPGTTNMVTALIESLNGGTPLVAIVGDTPRDHSWKNLTQEARQVDILRPAVKELIEVPTPARIPELLRRAFTVATSGRPGPVVLDIPENVVHAEFEYQELDFDVDDRYETIPAIRTVPDAASLATAAELIASAKCPVLLVGGGIHLSDAYEALAAFARATNIPVAHTITGTGAIPTSDPLCLGVFGRFDRVANSFIEQADVLLVVGCKLGEVATKRFTLINESSAIVHIDIVPEEFGRTHKTSMPLCGDARETLNALGAELAPRSEALRERLDSYAGEVRAAVAGWRTSVVERLHSDERPISMARVFNEINEALPPEGILVADGGFAAHWGALLFESRRAGRTFLPDRGFASIGYGMPGAIGAAVGAPDRPVVALTGDGGFNMMIGDLETARRVGISPTIAVVNNAASGYVKALQHIMYGPGNYHASDLMETDYATVAQAMGCHGVRVEDPNELAAAIREATETPEVSVIDIVVTRDPGEMLPAPDPRTVTIDDGDRLM